MRALLHDGFIVRHTRRAMVDFGFGRFLEMFEERFGRLPTTLLLSIIGVGVAAVCVSQIWEHLIAPLYIFLVRIIRLPGWKISLSILPAIISGVVTLMVMAMAVYLFSKWRVWLISRMVIRQNALLDRIKTQYVFAEDNLEKVQRAQERVRSIRAEVDAQLDKVKELRGQLTDMVDSVNNDLNKP